MSKKYYLVILVILVLTLSACTRAASSAPTATATPKANFPKPVATSGMNAIEIAGTQTAVATAGLPMPTSVGSESGTKNPDVLPTFTPLGGVEQTRSPETTSNLAATTPLPSPTTGTATTPEPTSHAQLPTAGPIVKPAAYVLHQGEFPYCLARRFNIDPDQLLTLNGLSSSQSYFAPGTSITIPQSGGAFPGTRALKTHPVQYTVRAGDTIYSVACEFGDVDPMAIASVNNLSGSSNLTVGTSILIP